MQAKVNILAIGDPHFRAKYTKVLNDFTSKIIGYVENKPLDMVVVLGDTLHSHEQARESCHTMAIKWFKEMAKHTKVVVLIGNHERPNNSHYLTENHFFNGIKGSHNIEIVDKVYSARISKGGRTHRFVFVPYVPPGRFQDALNTLETSIDVERPTAIFAHQEFKGCKMGAVESVHGDEWSGDKPMVISGHIHEHQVLADNLLYVGTPYQTTYAESMQKGVFIFTFNGHNAPEIKRVNLNLRVKQSITMDTNEFLKFEMPSNNNMDLRIIITGKYEAVEAIKQTSMYKNLRANPDVKLELRPTVIHEISNNIHKKSFLEAFKDEMKINEHLKDLSNEILQGIQ